MISGAWVGDRVRSGAFAVFLYAKTKDGYAWKCQNKHCTKYKSTITIRFGSFFTKSNLSLQSWVHAMYLWSERVSETMAYRQVGVSEKTMIDSYSFFPGGVQ